MREYLITSITSFEVELVISNSGSKLKELDDVMALTEEELFAVALAVNDALSVSNDEVDILDGQSG